MTEDSRPIVIKIMCGVKGCGRTLVVLSSRPRQGEMFLPPYDHEAWTDPERQLHPVWFESCRRHGGIARTIQEEDARLIGLGLDPVDRSRLMHAIRWRDLRDDFLRARSAKGRVAHRYVAPLGRL